MTSTTTSPTIGNWTRLEMRPCHATDAQILVNFDLMLTSIHMSFLELLWIPSSTPFAQRIHFNVSSEMASLQLNVKLILERLLRNRWAYLWQDKLGSIYPFQADSSLKALQRFTLFPCPLQTSDPISQHLALKCFWYSLAKRYFDFDDNVLWPSNVYIVNVWSTFVIQVWVNYSACSCLQASKAQVDFLEP